MIGEYAVMNKKTYFKYLPLVLVVILAAIFVYLLSSNLQNDLGVKKLDTVDVGTLNQGWRYSATDGTEQILEFPAKVKFQGAKAVINNTLPAEIEPDAYLAFYNHYCALEVRVNDKLIYTYAREEQPEFGTMYGDVLCTVALAPEYAGQDITLNYYNPYKLSTSFTISQIYLDNMAEISAAIIMKNLGVLVFSRVMVFLSVVFLGLYLLRLFRGKQKDSAIYFHVFAFVFLSAVWVITDSLLVQFLTSRTLLYGCVVSFCSFMTMVLPLIAVAKYICPSGRRIFTVFQLLILSYTIIAMLLYIGGVVDLVSSLPLFHLLYGTIAIAMEYFFLKEYRGRRNPLIIYALIANGLLLLVLLISLIYFYWGLEEDISRFYRYGIIVLSLSLIGIIIKKMKLSEELRSRMDVYRELAYLDVMTGLKNRNAFIKETELLQGSLSQHNHLAIISLDINNLKTINDVYGHSFGDEVIIAIANIIRKVFNGENMIYRIGGDEFVVIIVDREVDVALYRAALASEGEGRKLGVSSAVALAIGCSQCVLSQDSHIDMSEILKKADLDMYRDKLNIKEQGVGNGAPRTF